MTESNQPLAEHERLQELIGEWEVECSYNMGPSEEPLRAVGTDRVEALGPYWVVAHFEVTLPGGTHITGRSTKGYDPARGAFMGTWQDSANPYFYYFEGQVDDLENCLDLSGDNIDPMTKNLVQYRHVERFLSPEERTLHLYIESAPGSLIQILEYHYRRR